MSESVFLVKVRIRLLCSAVAALGLLICACTKTKVEERAVVEATPAPALPTQLANRVAKEEHPAVVPDTVPAPPSEPAATPKRPELPEDVAALEARYFGSRATPEEREAIVTLMARLDSQRAVPTLGRIFDRETRMELRLKVLEVAADISDDTSREGRWMLFSRAAAATQPVVVRLSAMQSLADMEDPRAPAVLKAMTTDSNAMIRENARRMLEEIEPK